jgi:hypothetical protein
LYIIKIEFPAWIEQTCHRARQPREIERSILVAVGNHAYTHVQQWIERVDTSDLKVSAPPFAEVRLL